MSYTQFDLKNLPNDLDPKALKIINNLISNNSYLMGTVSAWAILLKPMMGLLSEGKIRGRDCYVLIHLYTQLEEILERNLDPDMLPIIERASTLAMIESN